MGYIRDTFALAAYGLQDVFSGKVLYLKLWTSNSNPKLIGRWYLEHLSKTKGDKYWAIIDSILPKYLPHLDLLLIFKSKCTYANFYALHSAYAKSFRKSFEFLPLPFVFSSPDT